MSRTLSPSFARCYGLARVARVWKISRASISLSPVRRRQTRSAVALVRSEHVRSGIGRPDPPAHSSSRLHGEGYRKLWARLRFAGVRASPPCPTGDARKRLVEAATISCARVA